MSEKALNAVIPKAWINGVSTRKVDALVQSMGMTGISRSQVSSIICRGIDERVQFLHHPKENGP
ncbi:transposase, Mutator family protein, partial [Candidatus Erwinia dacicola]